MRPLSEDDLLLILEAVALVAADFNEEKAFRAKTSADSFCVRKFT